MKIYLKKETELGILIDLANETELAQGYVPFYERYIQTKIDIRNVDQLEDKLMEVLEVLNEYRKDSPE